MIRRRHAQRRLGEVVLNGLVVPAPEGLMDPGLRRIDQRLEDEALVDQVLAILRRQPPLSARRGRPGTPAEVVVRLGPRLDGPGLRGVFEPDAQILRRGKPHRPTEFGRLVKVQGTEGGVVTDIGLVPEKADAPLLLPSVERHLAVFGRAPQVAATDRGFYSTAWPSRPGGRTARHPVMGLAPPRDPLALRRPHFAPPCSQGGPRFVGRSLNRSKPCFRQSTRSSQVCAGATAGAGRSGGSSCQPRNHGAEAHRSIAPPTPSCLR